MSESKLIPAPNEPGTILLCGCCGSASVLTVNDDGEIVAHPDQNFSAAVEQFAREYREQNKPVQDGSGK